jgi:hypothetical protein
MISSTRFVQQRAFQNVTKSDREAARQIFASGTIGIMAWFGIYSASDYFYGK